MDRRLNYSYPRRSKPQKSYALDDDDDDNDVVLATIDDTDEEVEDDDDDEDFNDHRSRRTPTRHRRKQRKLSNCSNYQFAPRSSNSSDWSEQCTFVLLEIWGERFLQLGRSSLRSEDWNEVAERVSEATRTKRSVSECRNRLNALKVKYKREKGKVSSLGGGNSSKWVYFKKIDVLMTMSPRQLQQQEQCGLACGVDSGEFVFMNPRVYLDHSNALDEMRDSPGNSESEEDDDDGDEEEDDDEDEEEAEESYRMLSESIKRVGDIYEEIEDSKKQHMMELERMREEFQKELEVQKKEMIDRTKAEIAKLERKDDHDSDCSVENVSE